MQTRVCSTRTTPLHSKCSVILMVMVSLTLYQQITLVISLKIQMTMAMVFPMWMKSLVTPTRSTQNQHRPILMEIRYAMHWMRTLMAMESQMSMRMLETQSRMQQMRIVMAMVSVTDHQHLHCQPMFVLQDRMHSRTMLPHLKTQTVTAYQTNWLKALKQTLLPIRMTTVTIGPTKMKHSVEPARPTHQAHQSTTMAMEPVTLLIQTTTVTIGPTKTKHSVEPTLS